MKQENSLRSRLSTQKALIGLMQTYPNTALAEMAGICGYDYILLDCEPGFFSELDHLRTLQVISSTGMAAWVRLSGHDTRAVGRYLDMGAHGIVVPNVSTVEQTRDLVRAMDYPPAGTRGFGAPAHRATRYGMDLAAHLKFPRGDAFLVVMIESALGVANAEEILSIEGVDGVFIGPADLTADLGCAQEFSRPEYADAVGRIERAAFSHGKLVGTAPHPSYSLETLVARGHRLFIVGGDISLIQRAMTAQVEGARACLAAK